MMVNNMVLTIAFILNLYTIIILLVSPELYVS